MSQLQPIKFRKKDELYYLIPKLENIVRMKEIKLRKNLQITLLIGSIISFFSLRTGYELAKIYEIKLVSQNEQVSRQFESFFFILFSCLSGWFIDVLSIRISWLFFVLLNITGQILTLYAVITESYQILILGQIIFYSLLPVCIINFTCILYENSCEFRVRLNNAIQLEIFGEFLSIVIVLGLNAIKTIFQYNEISSNQILQSLVISGLIICQFINFLSLLILNSTYLLIDKIRQKSSKYSNYLIYQGTGLSLKRMLHYFSNDDMFYLCSLATVAGFQSRFINSIDYPISPSGNLQQLAIFLGSSLLAYFVMKIINSSKNLVQNCYKSVSTCIYILFVVNFSSILVYFLSQQVFFKTNVENLIEQIKNFVLISIFLILYSMIHQLLLFLLHQRCSIRGFSLSYTFVFYSTFYVISNLIESNDCIFYIFQMVHIALVAYYNYKYQKKRKYTFMETDLVIRYEIN